MIITKKQIVAITFSLALFVLGGCAGPGMPERPLQVDAASITPTSITEVVSVTVQAYLPHVASAPPTPTPVPTPDCTLTRGPYLQSVTQHSIIVVWETDRPSAGEVAFGETAAYTNRHVDPVVGTRHAVTLTGLVSATTYHYRLESNGAPLSGDYAFQTAAAPDTPAFTFVVFGDTRTQHDVHRAVVARIEALGPAFALHTGDLVERGDLADQWETFFDIEEGMMAHIPLFPALGNHERDAVHYFDRFYLPGNERWYVFDYGNARFVSLQIDGIAPFDPQSEQYAWLEQVLAANTQPWLFVYFHIPPYSALREDEMEIAVRQTLTPLFEQYGVDAVFNGHHHNYQRSVVDGLPYIIAGGGGAPIYPITETEPNLVAYRNDYHALLITITGDTLSAVGVTADGEEFDPFTLTSGS